MNLSFVATAASASLILLLGNSSDLLVHSFQLPSSSAGLPIISPRTSYTSLYSTNDDTDDSASSTTLQKEQIDEITKALEQAKFKFDESRNNVATLQKQRDDIALETENIIDKLKNSFVDEITDLGDQIEGAQDNLRQTISQTKSQLSSIQTNVVQREIQLKNELSDLERRLETLKQDATNVSKEREALNKSIDKDVRDIKRQSQKELNTLKAELLKEKKDITRTQRWELESRLQKAKVDKQPSNVALQEEKKVKPTLSSLKDTLEQIQSKFTPTIDDLKEQKNAKQMFFDTSWTNLKREKKDEINVAKDVYENEMKEEDELLKQTRVSYVDQLYNKEEELQRSQDQLAEPVELFGVTAISNALKERERILQEKDVAISNQQEEWTRTMKDAAESIIAIQDEYDAKLENANRNLKREELRVERELVKQDKNKQSRRIQLIYEREELTRSLSQLMVDEREAAKSEYQSLKMTKSDTLAKNLAQVQSTNNEIQVLRSKMVYVQQELNMLENTSRKAHVKLDELEDERGSFRKQLKRSVKVAVGKIPLIGSKVRE